MLGVLFHFLLVRHYSSTGIDTMDCADSICDAGRSSCVGKQLGLMEVRYVTAQIVRRYNVNLAPGQTPKAFLDGKRDTFTLALGELNLVFEPRK